MFARPSRHPSLLRQWPRLLICLLLVLFAVVYLMPIYVLVIAGMRSFAEVNLYRMGGLPSSFSLDSFAKAWFGSDAEGLRGLSGNFVNSVELAGLSLSMEIVHPNIPVGRIRYAFSDFDGKLSLIRGGWREVMIECMVGLLLQTPQHEGEAQLRSLVADYVDRLTGEQTIYQMIERRDQVKRRGGQPADPLEYKAAFHARLWERIQHRVAALKSKRIPPDDLMVPGAAAMLRSIRARRGLLSRLRHRRAVRARRSRRSRPRL